MTYSKIELPTLDVPAAESDDMPGFTTIRPTNRKAWEDGLIMVTPNIDRPKSFWLHFFAHQREWFSLLILDAAGNTVIQREKRSREGHNLLSLNAEDLEPGKYNLRILTGAKILSGSLSV